MRNIFNKLHLWLSIPFGLIVSTICFSGAVLVFEKEIMELVRHDLYHVSKIETQPLPIEQLMSTVKSILSDNVAITGVIISASPEKTYQVTLSKPRRASIYIDQYSAEIKGRYERAAFFTFMFRTHRWLLDSANPNGGIFWGKMVIGISTLMFVFVLISGIAIWIPRTRKALQNRLKVTTDKGVRRFFYDLHVAGGVYAATILLLLALTGLTWSFSWYRTGFYRLFGVETTASKGTASGNKTKDIASDREARESLGGNHSRVNNSDKYTIWSKVYADLVALNPNFKVITISDSKAAITTKDWGNQRAADSYEFDRHNGEITKMTKYRDSARSTKIRGWIYSVHVGDWGSWFSKTLTFFAAFIGSLLPLTGYYIWIKRSRRKRSHLKTH